MKKIIIVIILIIVIAFGTLYAFNIFNLKDILNGNSVTKTNSNNVETVTVKGTKLSLPPEFINSSVTIYDSKSITDKRIQKDSENDTDSYTIKMTNTLSKDELVKFYESAYPDCMSMNTETSTTLISGDTMLIIKIIISDNSHEITITKR